MITLLIFAFLGAYILYRLSADLYFAFLGLILGSILTILVLWAINLLRDENPIPVRIVNKITTLIDEKNISGTFFLGSGSVNGEMVYRFYKEVGQDTYELETLRSNEVKIRLVKGPARIITETFYTKSSTFFERYFLFKCEQREETIIEVPSGTIKNEMILDAE